MRSIQHGKTNVTTANIVVLMCVPHLVLATNYCWIKGKIQGINVLNGKLKCFCLEELVFFWLFLY